MQKERFEISDMPAVLWGVASDKVIIAVHGNMSHKTDVPIEILAANALVNGYQVLSFDLPEHGDRIKEKTLCKVQICVQELAAVMQYAKANWKHISLFANSIGAYFSLLAYSDESLAKVWFLAPVVDMQRVIDNMMMWCSVTKGQLECEQTIATPSGQNLYWDYYCYVKEHPISQWVSPTFILYGSKDDICEFDVINNFTEQYDCQLTVAQCAEHYFHTQEQLMVLNDWIAQTITSYPVGFHFLKCETRRIL